MGMRRRTRRRGLVAGAAIAHHDGQEERQAQQGDYQAGPGACRHRSQAQYAPPPADPADEIEHLAQLHASGALTDEEFAAAKAKVLGT